MEKRTTCDKKSTASRSILQSPPKKEAPILSKYIKFLIF